MINKDKLRDWLFRAIMFEADAKEFRNAGIEVGAEINEAEASLQKEALDQFGIGLRNEALSMARLYSLLYCFENTVRSLIKQRLNENYGAKWWDERVPRKVQEYASKTYSDADKNSWLEGIKSHPINFINFGHLSDIITSNWDDFSDLIPSQHWLIQRMQELEKARNYIAHNRMLQPNEFHRIELYLSDWDKSVGM